MEILTLHSIERFLVVRFQHLQTLAGGMQMLESNHEAAIPGFANEWLLSFLCRAGFLTQNRRPLLGKPA
jgi:hypothetical protein